METQGEVSTSRFKKVFGLLAVIAAGFALCAVMKNFVCGRSGEGCSCQEKIE